VLLDRLEDKMKGTPMDGTIKVLFEGRMSTLTRCLDVDSVSHWEGL
jgi:ubiquitin carboxyl-terminal hydrolase 7